MLTESLNKDPNPCLARKCAGLAYPVRVCREQGYGHRWQREAIEDRARHEGQAANGEASPARESCKNVASPMHFNPKYGQNRGDLRGEK